MTSFEMTLSEVVPLARRDQASVNGGVRLSRILTLNSDTKLGVNTAKSIHGTTLVETRIGRLSASNFQLESSDRQIRR